MILPQAVLPFVLLALAVSVAQAQTPGVVVEGSPTVSSGNLPASRAGDASTTSSAGVAEGSSNVFINGRPAARVGDRTDCGVIASGSSNVFINGRPMARAGDKTSGC